MQKSHFTSELEKMASANDWSFTDRHKWTGNVQKQTGERKVLNSICGSCMQRDCATKVYVEDGVVVKIEGNPEAPPNFGTLCARGNAEIMSLYNPYRIKTPLIRTNPEKGLAVDPKWKEATWEEALDLVAEQLKKVRQKDSRGLVICEGFGNMDAPVTRGLFARAFGTPNYMFSHGPLCTVHYATCLVQAGFPVATVDLEHCNYHITLGRSLGPNFGTTSGIRKFTKAMQRGMRLVVVDPRCSYEASKGEWVPIRPGTDLAFLLAMAHVILHEIKKYDVWFLKNRTNAPYLIGPDGNLFRDTETGKPLIWDIAADRPKPFDASFSEIALSGTYQIDGTPCKTGFRCVEEGMQSYTPEWAEKISTVPAATIRRIAHEFIEHAQIGKTIDIDGFTFPFRPVSINTERNVANHRGGTYADLTGKIINMLVGNLEVPGGCMSNGPRGPYLAPDEDGVVRPGYEANPIPFGFPAFTFDFGGIYPHKHTTPHLVANMIVNGNKGLHDYGIEAWLSNGSNLIRKVAQPDLFIEMFKKIPFHVAISTHIDETTIMADVVLPEHCSLERMRVEYLHLQHQTIDYETCGLHLLHFREPVEPIFDSRHIDDILMELAERIGVLYGKDGMYDWMNRDIDFLSQDDGLHINQQYQLDIDKKHSITEIYDRRIRSWKHNDKGWGIEELREKGYLECRVSPKEFYNYYYVSDSKTRHPFYFHRLKSVGDCLRANMAAHNLAFPGIDDPEFVYETYLPVPKWLPNSEFTAPPEFDLYAINWKTPFQSSDSNNVTGNPVLAEIYRKDPTNGVININSQTARRKGIRNGDLLVVESRYGKTEARAYLSQIIHPEVIGISNSYGSGTIQSNPLNRIGPHFNRLIPTDESTLDSISAGLEIAPRVKIYIKEKSH